MWDNISYKYIFLEMHHRWFMPVLFDSWYFSMRCKYHGQPLNALLNTNSTWIKQHDSMKRIKRESVFFFKKAFGEFLKIKLKFFYCQSITKQQPGLELDHIFNLQLRRYMLIHTQQGRMHCFMCSNPDLEDWQRRIPHDKCLSWDKQCFVRCEESSCWVACDLVTHRVCLHLPSTCVLGDQIINAQL